MRAITGKALIAAERQRQIEVEGWTQSHDDMHGADNLEMAALCYRDAINADSKLPAQWPWVREYWRPKGRQRNLERAGALYQAAADAAARVGDYKKRKNLLGHVDSCAILLDSIIG
ncbi:hypothetical protein [Aeromonas caviae]|uniref:hypothetical protein n=1 Tax=Aeromonas caviae TaxID=648 RepID=UPI001CC393DD|nr:hypothetical protein [Aeromonas caviae]GJA77761.1 hypothetical protein KAM354_29970 [Aeromonas caviae]